MKAVIGKWVGSAAVMVGRRSSPLSSSSSSSSVSSSAAAASASSASSSSSSSITKKVQPHAFQSFDLVFLGTGGSNPSRGRGMPSTLLDLGGELWMFDVGEGTVRQSVFVRTCMDTSRVFITHMHADHIFGLPGLIVHTGMKTEGVEQLPPLSIYGPYGLFEFLKTSLRLSEATFTREVVVHEMIVSDEDSKGVLDRYGRSPWKKPPGAYRPSPSSSVYLSDANASAPNSSSGSYGSRTRASRLSDQATGMAAGRSTTGGPPGCEWEDDKPEELSRGTGPNLRRVLLHSTNGIWTCLDDPRVSVTAGLISHKIPCFGYIVKEVDKAGALLDDECKKRGLHFKTFPDLKLGKDVVLDDGSVIKASDFTGLPLKGRKLVYLGDTSDASNLTEAARDCDILIHESTTDDARRVNAAKKGHATPTVAANMALRCNARRLILNHIGAQFLPMGSSYRQRSSSDVRPDADLAREAKRAFGRPEDVFLARDFVSLKIPMGGYRSDDDNKGFSDVMFGDGGSTHNHHHRQGDVTGDSQDGGNHGPSDTNSHSHNLSHQSNHQQRREPRIMGIGAGSSFAIDRETREYHHHPSHNHHSRNHKNPRTSTHKSSTTANPAMSNTTTQSQSSVQPNKPASSSSSSSRRGDSNISGDDVVVDKAKWTIDENLLRGRSRDNGR